MIIASEYLLCVDVGVQYGRMTGAGVGAACVRCSGVISESLRL